MTPQRALSSHARTRPSAPSCSGLARLAVLVVCTLRASLCLRFTASRIAAASFLLGAAALTAAPAAAQYRSPLSAFASGSSLLSHAAPDPRWDRIAFPARKNRRPMRALNSTGLAQRREVCEPHLAEAAKLYTLPLDFLRAVAHVESGFHSNALSVDGAMGIMQLMPFTARRMGVTRPEDARQNILGGARFLRILANQWAGNIVLTIASYNAGAGAVKKYRGVPPFAETQRYVRRVLDRLRSYSQERRRNLKRSHGPDAQLPVRDASNPHSSRPVEMSRTSRQYALSVLSGLRTRKTDRATTLTVNRPIPALPPRPALATHKETV